MRITIQYSRTSKMVTLLTLLIENVTRHIVYWKDKLMTIFWVILVLQALICGFLSMDLAEKKGYSSGTWLAIGLFFGIFGLIAAAGLPRKQVPMSASVLLKKCPDCAESIRKEALVCKFCGANFSKEQVITELLQALEENYTAAMLEVLEALRTTHDDSVVPHLVRCIDAVGSQIIHPYFPKTLHPYLPILQHCYFPVTSPPCQPVFFLFSPTSKY